MRLGIAIICIAVILYVLFFVPCPLERFTSMVPVSVRFLDKYETRDLLYRDADGYIETLKPTELSERTSFGSTKEYRNQVATRAVSFHIHEQSKIVKLCKMIDTQLQQKEPKKAAQLPPWTFALTEGNTYEMGMPHMRRLLGRESGPVYFLSTQQLDEEIHSECQLMWTLFYLRLQTLFPRRRDECDATGVVRPLQISQMDVPEEWGLPRCV